MALPFMGTAWGRHGPVRGQRGDGVAPYGHGTVTVELSAPYGNARGRYVGRGGGAALYRDVGMVGPRLGTTGALWVAAPPQDSYMLEYFAALNQYLAVGVPTYFVTTGGYNFSSPAGINSICSSAGCATNSLTHTIQYATRFPNV